jgi:hypothetical protein
VQRPTTRFVPAKTNEQLDVQALHRVRSRLVSERTAVINQIRGFLLERGIIVRQGLRFRGWPPPHVAPVARRIGRTSDGGSEGTAQADPKSISPAFPPRTASWNEEMEKRSRRRVPELVTRPAFQGSENEIGRARISMMARNANVPFKGRIQKRKTYHLQIITFGLQRAAGPYSRVMNVVFAISVARPLTLQDSP